MLASMNNSLIQKYSIFQLILFSKQKCSPVNCFENSTMPITHIYKLIFYYFSFKFWFSYLYTFWLLLYFKCWFSLIYNLILVYVYCLIVVLIFYIKRNQNYINILCICKQIRHTCSTKGGLLTLKQIFVDPKKISLSHIFLKKES